MAEALSNGLKIEVGEFGNPRHCYTFRESFQRTRQLANALHRPGAKADDRIATLAWNDYRHFELYNAISGSAMDCHTINPRLFPEQVAYIINHAAECDVLRNPARSGNQCA